MSFRNTLDWLDVHPYVRGNWDMDNAFTTDDWMVEHSPDIITRISERVANGGMRFDSCLWNNGAMASSKNRSLQSPSAEPLRAIKIPLGQWSMVSSRKNACSHQTTYSGTQTTEWTGSPFSMPPMDSRSRSDITLDGIAQHNPVTLTDPLTDASMTQFARLPPCRCARPWGLSGWAKQLSQRASEDQLLVIHFDADAESWESFALELDAADALDFVEWTTISAYLETHAPVDTVEIFGDVADGTGDGFQSWANDFNHRLFTEVLRARQSAALANFWAERTLRFKICWTRP